MSLESNAASLESLKSHCEDLVQQFEATIRHQTALVNEVKEIISKIESEQAEETLSSEVLSKFSLESWAPKVEVACEESQVFDEARRKNISELVGHRLGKISALAKVMDAGEDTEDLRHHLVYSYVELKSEWYQLNSLINYGYMYEKPPEPETEVLAVLVSWIIASLDTIFSSAEIEVLTDYLFAPLGSARELQRVRCSSLAA